MRPCPTWSRRSVSCGRPCSAPAWTPWPERAPVESSARLRNLAPHRGRDAVLRSVLGAHPRLARGASRQTMSARAALRNGGLRPPPSGTASGGACTDARCKMSHVEDDTTCRPDLLGASGCAGVQLSCGRSQLVCDEGGRRASLQLESDEGSLGRQRHRLDTFLAIQAAAAEGSRRGMKLEQCRIEAVESDERLVVIFGNHDPSHKWRGCPPGPCTCFEVELTKDGLRLIGAHFSK